MTLRYLLSSNKIIISNMPLVLFAKMMYTVTIILANEVLMMDYVTAKEKANEWGISLRRVQLFCEQGRIPGVTHMGKMWIIPKDAERPSDKRYKENKLE